MIKTFAAATVVATVAAFAVPGATLAAGPGVSLGIQTPDASLRIGSEGLVAHFDRGRGWDRDRHFDRLSEREVRRILRHNGWREIRFLDRNFRTYTVRAENWRGRDRILVVSALNGRILDNRPARWR